MFDIASSEYSVDEGKTVEFEVKRVGGSAKKATATFQAAPSTVVHGKILIFEDGDESQFVDVKTIYHEEPIGDLNFYAEIVNQTDCAITGFNHSSTVNDIQSYKKLANENSLSKSKKVSNPLAVYILVATMAVVAIAAYISLVVLKKQINEPQDQSSLNSIDKVVYTE